MCNEKHLRATVINIIKIIHSKRKTIKKIRKNEVHHFYTYRTLLFLLSAGAFAEAARRKTMIRMTRLTWKTKFIAACNVRYNNSK